MKVLMLALAFIFSVESLRKCCYNDEILERFDDTFQCFRSADDLLFRILTNETGLLNSNHEGRCVDHVTDNFYLFDVRNDSVFQVEELDVSFQHKCCQTDSFYESLTGKCLTQNRTMDLSFLESSYVKIGPPECQILQETMDVTGPSCVDRNENGTVIRMGCGNVTEICQTERCVRKCCPDGFSFVNNTVCTKTGKSGLDLYSWEGRMANASDFKILYNSSCGELTLLELIDLNDLDMESKDAIMIVMNVTIHPDDVPYCIEHFMNSTTEDYMFYICLGASEYYWNYVSYALLASIVFLPLTIVIYIILGETKKIFGKVLVCYCLVMLCWFSITVDYHMFKRLDRSDAQCYFTAVFLTFSQISTFTWLSVLCWDVFRTFGSTKSLAMSLSKGSSIKTMAYYALYALGVPTVLVSLFVVFLIYDNILPTIIQPYLESGVCVFGTRSDSYAAFCFLFIPIMIIQTSSTILFILTIVYCIKIKRGIKKSGGVTSQIYRKNYQRLKDRLHLVLKLMVVILPTITIIVYTTANLVTDDPSSYPKVFQYFLKTVQFITASQGLLMFIICVCNRRIIGKIIALGSIVIQKLSTSKYCFGSKDTIETSDTCRTNEDSVTSQETLNI